MKQILYILVIFFTFPFTGYAQNDNTISKQEQTTFKNQIDLDVQLFGMSFSFKKEKNKTGLSFGLKVGFGFIQSSPYGSGKYMENIYIQPIINWTFMKRGRIETGPRLSIIVNDYGVSEGVLAGLSASFFLKIWKIQVGTRTQMSYVGGNQSYFKSSIIFSQEAIILRIPLKQKD